MSDNQFPNEGISSTTENQTPVNSPHLNPSPSLDDNHQSNSQSSAYHQQTNNQKEDSSSYTSYEEHSIPDNQDKTLGMLVHIIAIFSNIIAPLIIFLIAEDYFTKENAKEALNFQITMLIGYVISFILMFVLIGIVGLVILGPISLIFSIIAAVKANEGTIYRYPVSLRLIK